MRVELTADDQTIVEHLVSSGRFASVEQALHAGITQLQEQETEATRTRELVQEAINSADQGEIIRGEDFLRERSEARLKRA